ncbi:MAG: EAL domain-containing protein [Lachnospiraceae bacterium]
MKVYVARQPIFDVKNEVFGYELLYRNNNKNAYDSSIEGSEATKNLLSDVTTVFKLQSLTNQKYAFVNFTKELLLQKLPKVLDEQEIVVEVLEDVIPDEELIECIKDLKKRKMKIALDDYFEPGPIDVLIPYADIIKVDFSFLNPDQRDTLAKSLNERAPHVRLLAEKVETEEEYERAKKAGYELFQGYYFSKPVMFSTSSVEIANSTGMRLFKEVNEECPSYQKMADIMKTDVGMTYAILKKMNTLGSFRGNQITNIKDALVRMGLFEVKKWVTLKIMRSVASDAAEESVRTSLVRGLFSEEIAKEVGWNHLKESAFMVGILSGIDPEMNEEITKVLSEMGAYEDVKDALLGSDNELRRILVFVKMFEEGRWDEMKQILEVQINEEHVSDLYIRAVHNADEIFDGV